MYRDASNIFTVFSWSINIICITNLLPVDYIFLQEAHSVPELLVCIMSTSRRSKKVKPVNLEDQPIISQFIVDSAISPASPKSAKNQETKSKKRRRSTGNNNPVNKRHNSVPNPLTSTEENPTKMTDNPMEMSSATNTMLNEIKKMEERLNAQITTSKC